MPVPRHAALVICSCGKRWGNLARASAHEDMEAAELTLIASYVPNFRRHWELRHALKLREGAPMAYAAVIAKAAAEMRGPEAEPEAPGRLALTAGDD